MGLSQTELLELIQTDVTWEQVLQRASKVCKLEIQYTTRSTGTIVVRCIFHEERTPSLVLWPRSGNFNCFGCGRNGNKANLYETWLRIHFREYTAFTNEIERFSLSLIRAHKNNPAQLTLPFTNEFP